MKKIILPILLLLTLGGFAQYNNSWIDYSKTYFKFKVTTDGLYRIPQGVLVASGLGSANADHYQLWRNGQQVRLYTSVTNAPLSATDYIEFVGRVNDGAADTKLFKDQAHHLSDKYSLYSDTATYFLTVNTAGNNLRYTSTGNNAAAPATPDAYFMRDVNMYFRNKINSGLAQFAGELVYSSSYDEGEGWTSPDIYPTGDFTQTLSNLNVYTAGPANSLTVRANVAGNANNFRNLTVRINGDSIYGQLLLRYASRKVVINNLSLSKLTNPSSATIKISGSYPNLTPLDRLVVASLGITYPASFNFNGAKEFAFSLAPSANGNHLQIDNFNYGSSAPVLFDLTTGARIVGDISSVPGKIKFLIAASGQTRNFVLINSEASNINSISSLVTKNFLNITNAAQQSDYLIISNSSLYSDNNGINQVERYRAYRASTNGGSYNAKVYNIDELTDQFGYGIYHHTSSIKDFILNAVDNWSVKPKHVFLIGRGISYNNLADFGNQAAYKATDLVPTFGWPASDLSLAARPGLYAPTVPVGRLSAVNGNEVRIYLQKMEEYETNQRTASCSIADKAWMKNFMHVIGGKDSYENNLFSFYMNGYRDIAKAPFMGGYVETFSKGTSAAVEQASSQRIFQYIAEGLGVMTYFGHSSTNTLEFNLSNPEDYGNQGKYPFFEGSGCNAGDYYRYDPNRLTGALTLSEKYMLAPQKGTIGFLASTHFGIPQNLDAYVKVLYREFSKNTYGATIGEQMKKSSELLGGLNPNLDFFTRMHIEQGSLHGDPALKLTNFAKPDYAIEAPLVKINPNIITVADANYDVKINYRNIGRATDDSIRITVKRQLPDNSLVTIFNAKKLAAYNGDSLSFTLTINPVTDKGLNKIIVMLDEGDAVSELCESNNSITKDFYILEDELRPIFPYNYAVVNNSNFKFVASTANPLGGMRDYIMEMDTTELFNSAFKKTYTTSGIGGVVEFPNANVSFVDGTVYYWRVSIVPIGSAQQTWNSSSFTYLPNSTPGFAQSHYFQHKKSAYDTLQLKDDRKFYYDQYTAPFKVTNGLFPPYNFDQLQVSNGVSIVANWGTSFNTFQFVVFDGVTGEVKINVPQGGTGAYGSTFPSASRPRQFEFSFNSAAGRKKIMDFIDSMPSNAIIISYPLLFSTGANQYIDTWKNDTLLFGSGTSLYHKFKNYGFDLIDSFTFNRPFITMFSKNAAFPTGQLIGAPGELITLNKPILLTSINGVITSPYFGPALSWDMFHWGGQSSETPTFDKNQFNIYGSADNSGTAETLLATVTNLQDTTISFINAQQYPYLRVKSTVTDVKNGTPYQLQYIRLNGGFAPEGAVAPNIAFSAPDTVYAGESYNFSLAFKNISPVAFDSLIRVKFVLTDKNNVAHPLDIPARKALVSGDTLLVNYSFNSLPYDGNNTLFIEFNPNNHQREQYHFNNILYKSFFAKADVNNPTLDVTFDAVHILNRDIVASQPSINIKLNDENRFVALADTALLKVQVRFPDNSVRTYKFDGDTMRFTPASLGSGTNTAEIDFKPYFPQDGTYELIVSGKDVSGNQAGALEYKVLFNVINKAMISNLLNYPNPFTSSTAFVFTLTGNEIPQNMRIQILTVTGKVVKEITQAELGNIHVGRNITDYKWDGTDMYGQKLANGVYLYRVITNLNGKSLDKYTADDDNTDQYFNKGYGKMYLMR